VNGMNDLTLSTAWTLHGLRTILIENRFLRLVVLPEAGAKIYQITYKPLDAPLLWNHPRIVPSRHTIHAHYDDVWSGGWDELFPNDEAGTLHGEFFPDHGELWTGSWEAEPFHDRDSAGVHLRFSTPISSFLVERTIRLRSDSANFEIHYRFTNQNSESFPFLWKQHPAFAVSAHHRIDFPRMTVIRETGFPGTLRDAPVSFPWPYANLGSSELDLRQIPDTSSRALHFFYGTELASGWCGITNRATGLATALRFDPEIFSSCWLFASHGGWRNLNVAVLEPSTGYPFQIQQMIDAQRARWLAPGETLETSVLFATQQGLKSVGGIDESGHILPGDEL
jgi:galactose mutarotase-like enzyme